MENDGHPCATGADDQNDAAGTGLGFCVGLETGARVGVEIDEMTGVGMTGQQLETCSA